MTKYGTGKIIPEDQKGENKFCCIHKNLVPLEIGFASKTYPNGYKAEPNYNFATNIISANIIRIRSYLCLDCKQEIKAPEPGTIKKDRL